MIRRPPRSTQSRSSAASDVYKRQVSGPPYRRPPKRRFPWHPPPRTHRPGYHPYRPFNVREYRIVDGVCVRANRLFTKRFPKEVNDDRVVLSGPLLVSKEIHEVQTKPFTGRHIRAVAPLQVLTKAIHHALQNSQEKFLFLGEVVGNQPLANARLGSDLIQSGAMKTKLEYEAQSRFGYLRTPGFFSTAPTGHLIHSLPYSR